MDGCGRLSHHLLIFLSPHNRTRPVSVGILRESRELSQVNGLGADVSGCRLVAGSRRQLSRLSFACGRRHNCAAGTSLTCFRTCVEVACEPMSQLWRWSSQRESRSRVRQQSRSPAMSPSVDVRRLFSSTSRSASFSRSAGWGFRERRCAVGDPGRCECDE